MQFTATEILNTLATMPEMSKAIICGQRVERVIFGYSVNDGPVTHPRTAAEQILAAAQQLATRLHNILNAEARE
jgi:hypothetical protein